MGAEPPLVLNQLLRYEPVVRLLEPLRGGRLLDVGSGSYGVARWLSRRWDVVAVDVSFDDYGGAAGPVRRGATPVLGSATHLPFPDRSFDAVVALDVLEHIPPDLRSAAVEDLCRVTSGRLILACPTGRAAYEADRRLHDFYQRRDGNVIRWLREHVEFGLPDRTEIVSALHRHGNVTVRPHQDPRRMLRLMLSEARPLGRRAQTAVARALQGAVREGRRRRSRMLKAIGGGDREPGYRTIAVMDRRGSTPATRS